MVSSETQQLRDEGNEFGSDLEDGVSEPQPVTFKRTRFIVAAAFGVAAVFGVAGALQNVSDKSARKAKFQKYIPHSHPDFVNYVATPVPQNLAVNRLCDPVIVQTTCFRLNNETTEYWANAIDADPNYIHAAEVSEALSVSKASVIEMFRNLKLSDFSDTTNPDSLAVSCQELCEKLVASYPHNAVPTHSDVGCYRSPVNGTPVCPVDVSPAALQALSLNVPAATQATAFGERRNGPSVGRVHWNQIGNAHVREQDAVLDNALNERGAGIQEQQALLYPPVSWDDLRMSVINLFRIFPVIHSGAVHNTGINKFFGKAPREPHSLPRRLYTAAWKETTLQLAVKAKAYVSSALRKMQGRQIGHIVKKWFGNNLDSPTRQEIKRVLSGVQSMLGNVDYVYPGDQCQPNVYAYVYPAPRRYARNAQGQYVFHLCDYYMKVGEGEKIETLTHEGSHHLTMETDDTDWGGQTMYGRYMCEQVAGLCASGNQQACTASRRNADSYCYFINDAAASAGGVQQSTQSSSSYQNELTDTRNSLPAGSVIPGVPTQTTPTPGGLFGSLR